MILGQICMQSSWMESANHKRNRRHTSSAPVLSNKSDDNPSVLYETNSGKKLQYSTGCFFLVKNVWHN